MGTYKQEGLVSLHELELLEECGARDIQAVLALQSVENRVRYDLDIQMSGPIEVDTA
jgi:hypothetical protein